MNLFNVRKLGATYSVGDGLGIANCLSGRHDADDAPVVFTFVGNSTKQSILTQLFQSDQFLSPSLNQGFFIHTDSLRTTSNRRQDLIFNIDTSVRFADHLDIASEQITLAMAIQSPEQLWCLLVSQLVLPFTDVLIMCVDDFEGMDNIIKVWEEWASLGPASNLPPALRPSLVVLDTDSEHAPTLRLVNEELLHSRLGLSNDLFSNISLICIDNALQETSSRLLSAMIDRQRSRRAVRTGAGWSFSVAHLPTLFHRAIYRLGRNPLPPFNFVKECCFQRSIGNMRGFLKQAISELAHLKAPSRVLSQFIAGHIIKDYYVPRAHVFPTQVVFDEVYKEDCLSALTHFYEQRFATTICKDVQRRLTSLERQLPFLLAKDIFERNLRPIHSWMKLLRLEHFCLGCPHRRPEQILSCEHRICDTCLRIHGKECLGHENRFVLTKCPLCGAGSLTKRLKPATAGFTILSIDGGGARGIIPLEFLNILQSGLGPSCRVQDLFDLVAGTSSGGLIALVLFLMTKTIKEATELFVDMTRKVFKTTGGSFDRFIKVFRALTKDAAYDIIDLEQCLKETFTDQKRMYDHEGTRNHAKVFVTASNISTGEPFIFANYNGTEPRQKLGGYKHMRAIKANDEPTLWEIGRATTAAPFFFNSINIPTLGTFQDGGLQQNNPVCLALWEARILWPHNVQPDFVLSLGTGTDMNGEIQAPFRRSRITDSAIFRCLRSWKTELDGQTRWKEFCSYSQNARRLERLNLILPTNQLSLDRADAMDDLQKTLRASYSVKNCESIAAALLASRLYFQLDGSPFQTAHGQYYCSGVICSEITSSRLIPALKRLCGSQKPSFRIDRHTIASFPWDEGVCSSCNRFRAKVQFLAPGIDSSFSIVVELNKNNYTLGAFPKPLSWFIERQGLRLTMGTNDHDVPGKVECPSCEPNAARKRKIAAISQTTNKKRRRMG